MKILHGVREVAGQGIYSVLGLRERGCDATMAAWDKIKFNYPCDICLNVKKESKLLYPWYAVKMFAFFLFALFRYDTYHFHFGSSLLPLNLDLQLLKLLNKRLIFEFHGTDLRQPSKMRSINQYYSMDDIDKPKKDKRNAKLCRAADYVIIHDEELRQYLPEEAQGKTHIVPLRLDIGKFQPNIPEENVSKVVIAHATSHRGIKGSEFIIDAVNRLSEKYSLELVVIENMPQSEAFKLYKKADIIVDQLILGTYGVFSIEAMAMGKPVVSYIADYMRVTFPDELPVVSATVDTIYNVLEDLIKDSKKRRSIGAAGREYASRYHNYSKISGLLCQIYEGNHWPIGAKETFEKL